MIGAYQEILGDLHNLFGDTHAVHVDVHNGNAKVQSIVKGDTVREVLGYVQYEGRELVDKLQDAVEDALQHGHITNEQAGDTVSFTNRPHITPTCRAGRMTSSCTKKAIRTTANADTSRSLRMARRQ